MNRPDPVALAAAQKVARTCAAQVPGLLAVYLHGSAALGGFAAASDLDVLAIGEDPGRQAATRLGEELLRLRLDVPLEFSLVSPAAARAPVAPWPFLLHVASTADRVVHGVGQGDPDLISHYLVTRARGVAVLGPEASGVIGEIPREVHLQYLRHELAWGLDHADARYAVLNAARAVAYAREGLVLSKVDGALWWTRTFGPSPELLRAQAAQRAGRALGRSDAADRAFVHFAAQLLM